MRKTVEQRAGFVVKMYQKRYEIAMSLSNTIISRSYMLFASPTEGWQNAAHGSASSRLTRTKSCIGFRGARTEKVVGKGGYGHRGKVSRAEQVLRDVYSSMIRQAGSSTSVCSQASWTGSGLPVVYIAVRYTGEHFANVWTCCLMKAAHPDVVLRYCGSWSTE